MPCSSQTIVAVVMSTLVLSVADAQRLQKCVHIQTGSASSVYAGYLKVKIWYHDDCSANGYKSGSVDLPLKYYAQGDTVIKRCFGCEVRTVHVSNGNNDAWIGAVMFMDTYFGGVSSGSCKDDCLGPPQNPYFHDGKTLIIAVDGDSNVDWNSQPYQTYCNRGQTCLVNPPLSKTQVPPTTSAPTTASPTPPPIPSPTSIYDKFIEDAADNNNAGDLNLGDLSDHIVTCKNGICTGGSSSGSAPGSGSTSGESTSDDKGGGPSLGLLGILGLVVILLVVGVCFWQKKKRDRGANFVAANPAVDANIVHNANPLHVTETPAVYEESTEATTSAADTIDHESVTHASGMRSSTIHFAVPHDDATSIA